MDLNDLLAIAIGLAFFAVMFVVLDGVERI
jgi:hypothetical protein